MSETAPTSGAAIQAVATAAHLARIDSLTDHERRKLLDALDAVPREAVEQEAERCAREVDAVAQVEDMAVNAWRRRAERAEAKREEYRTALRAANDRLRDAFRERAALMSALRSISAQAGRVCEDPLRQEPS